MFSSDSETECNVEKFSSEKSLPDEFDTVPSNKEFKLKFSAGGKTQLRIQSYILKEGKLLPYVVNMKGYMVEFSKSLRPAVEGYTEYENGAWWCFDKKENYLDLNKSLKSEVLSPSIRTNQSSLDKSEKSRSDSSICDLYDDLQRTPSRRITNITSLNMSCEDQLGESETVARIKRSALENNQDRRSSKDDDKMRMVIVKDLPDRLVNCNRLFHLVWQYGQVEEITFQNIGEEDVVANILMANRLDAERLVTNLVIGKVLDVKVSAHIIDHGLSQGYKPVFELSDGSNSYKKCLNIDSCSTTENSVPPTKNLLFSLSSSLTYDELKNQFEKASVSKVPKIVFDNDERISGIVEFNSVIDATEALISGNQKNYKGRMILLKFGKESESAPAQSTSHTQPNWLNHLKKNMKTEIIDQCSSRTRQSVEDNEYIVNDYDFKKVKAEIISMLMDKIRKVFGGVGKPALDDWRELVIQLGYEYPTMFRDYGDEESGRRRVDSVKRLGLKLCDNYREKLYRERKSNLAKLPVGEDDNVECIGKKKRVYGVDSEKYHTTKKVKPDVLVKFGLMSNEPTFEKREEVYQMYRVELHSELRNAKNDIKKFSDGFLKDHRHLSSHFAWLTAAEPLNQKVEENLYTQLDHLETYLRHKIQTLEFMQNMENVELVCEMELNGSRTFKDIHLLRLACSHFDKTDGSDIIRIESDGPCVTSSPHLVSVRVDKSFIFELWVEGTELMGKMDMGTAIASFLHLCFILNLQYPKGGQTVADLLQRGVAEYGDNTGTKTWRRRDTAARKIEEYYEALGRILAKKC